MANKHVERCSKHNYNEITSHWSGWPSSKSLQTNAGEGVEKRECSCTVGGNVIDTTTMKASMEILLKTRNKTTL